MRERTGVKVDNNVLSCDTLCKSYNSVTSSLRPILKTVHSKIPAISKYLLVYLRNVYNQTR